MKFNNSFITVYELEAALGFGLLLAIKLLISIFLKILTVTILVGFPKSDHKCHHYNLPYAFLLLWYVYLDRDYTNYAGSHEQSL